MLYISVGTDLYHLTGQSEKEAASREQCVEVERELITGKSCSALCLCDWVEIGEIMWQICARTGEKWLHLQEHNT